MDRDAILLQNYQAVQATLSAACRKAGRNPGEITLLAVTKYAQDADVLFLLEKGLIRHIGESRVQQAWARWTSPAFAKYSTVKHLIGHLQKNKAAKAAALFDFIDSLDDEQTAQLLATHAPAGKVLRGLVQVKLTDKATQSGLPLGQARQLAAKLRSLPSLRVCGYMAIAPQGADEQTLKALFAPVRAAFEADFPPGQERYLSLGMSGDYPVAVQMGSTLPRIGSRLFATNLEGL